MTSSSTYEPGARIEGVIPLCVPEIRGREWEYVKECLDTGWVSSVGSYVTRFEEMCALATGATHAVATVNGTAALHMALLAVGIEPDDEVLLSTLTFIAPCNAIRYVGAWPVLIDAEQDYWEIDVAKIELFLTERCSFDGTTLRNIRTGRPIRAILPVSVLGHPVQLDEIIALGRRYGLAVIEDATESLGAQYKDRPIGSKADVTALSFNGNKLITTGGGGMVLTNDPQVAKRVRYLSTQAKDDPVEYVHGEVGYNYRPTNIAAALGVAQLEQLDSFVAIKRANAARYTELLNGIAGITPMREAPWAKSAYWLYTILVDEVVFGMSSRALLKRLGEQHVQARPLWQPMHQSPANVGLEAIGGDVAESICRDALSIPSSVGLTATQLEAVVEAIKHA